MKKLIAMLAACCVSTAAQAQEETISWKQLNEHWRMGMAQGMCMVETAYKSKLELTIRSFSTWKGFDLYMCHPDWRITEDKEYSARLYVDDGNYGPFKVKGANQNCVYTDGYWGWQASLFKDLSNKKWWQFTINGKKISQKDMLLTGSKEAMWVLKQCSDRMSSESFPEQGDTF